MEDTNLAYCSKHNLIFKYENENVKCPACERGDPEIKNELFIFITCQKCGRNSSSDEAVIIFDDETGRQCGALCEDCKATN